MQENGFTVRRAHDLSSVEFLSEMHKFLEGNAKKTDGRLLFFYSGHGHYDTESSATYLIPTNGTEPDNDNFFLTTYSTELIKNSVSSMRARQALFIFDNCFSGVALKGSVLKPKDRLESSARYKALKVLSSNKVRQFVSAGGPEQLLPSTSIFLPILIQGIQGAASRSDDGYVTGKELALFVSDNVLNLGVGPENGRQHPMSNLLREFSGDMIFQYGDTAAVEPNNSNTVTPQEIAEAEAKKNRAQEHAEREKSRAAELAKASIEVKTKAIERAQDELNAEDALRQRRDQYATCRNAKGILPKSICNERIREFKNE